MIEMRRRQLSFGDGLIVAEVGDLREDWMMHADAVLADEGIVAIVYEALAKRHPRAVAVAVGARQPRWSFDC
jgi:transposase, IS5 family